MSAPANSTAVQQGAKATPHTVRIVYGAGLVVQDYPPPNLKAGDTIVFEPVPAGELELTFEYGSNFRQPSNGATVGRGQTISGHKPSVEVIRTMEPPELEALKAEVQAEGWFQEKIDELTLDAFPFLCKLTATEYGGPAGAKTPPETYDGGFPRPPRK